VKEVRFLGMIIGFKEINKDVQKFLGLANYSCQFIKDFTIIARPLHDMAKKDKK